MSEIVKFEKITKDILDSFVLNSHEKIIYVILKSFEKAPRGIRISINYLKERTGIKSKTTIIKYLDNLQNLGYITRLQNQFNKPSSYQVSSKGRQDIIRRHNIKKKGIRDGLKHRLEGAKILKLVSKE